MLTTSERRRAYKGPVLFSHGFRVFFLLAGIWAALAMILWVIFLATGTPIPSRMIGTDWHMHEMVFGYSSAVIAGFLLTAVPNWTGRLPVLGWPVVGLSGIWVAGRLAIFVSEWLPAVISPLVDIAFLIVLGAVLAREIIAGKNWRNLKVLGVVALMAISNGIFHYETLNGSAINGYGIRMGVGTIVSLIILIGGRVIPSFTRNWLVRQGPGRLPTPVNRFDAFAIAIAIAAVLLWLAAPEFVGSRLLNMIAGAAHAIRLTRWAGWRTVAEPLVLILHVGYAFVPLGFLLLAISGGTQIPHAWMVGVIGVVTLAMMTRVSLGHSGRPLASTKAIVALYGAIILAALLRITTEFLPHLNYLLYISATMWIAAFAGFAIAYYPILAKPHK
ncbi:hypothetical protein A9Q96_01960 [Rhodobacterales bacterium 52_120_T64]|nr:hypothetical protein A9Q96_01960 [Rhodobacterales bacterium 52_120_T64]